VREVRYNDSVVPVKSPKRQAHDKAQDNYSYPRIEGSATFIVVISIVNNWPVCVFKQDVVALAGAIRNQVDLMRADLQSSKGWTCRAEDSIKIGPSSSLSKL
jgi:hypothetical protein